MKLLPPVWTALTGMALLRVVASAEYAGDNDNNNMERSYLSSLVALDRVTGNVTQRGNLDVVHYHDDKDGVLQEEEEVPICRMDYMVGLSAVIQKRRVPINSVDQVEGAAAVALACEHLNTGDGSVVAEVEGLNKRCNIKFQFQALDSFLSPKLAADQVIDLTSRSNSRQPCIFLGNIQSKVTLSTAMITGMRGYPQIGYSTATELEDRTMFPLAARILPSLGINAEILVRYLREQLNVKHLAVLHTDTRESQSYSVALQQAAATLAPDLDLVSLDIPDQLTSPEILQRAVTKLKETNFTYFFGAIRGGHWAALWNETLAQGIAGTGRHTWIYPAGDEYFKSLVVPRDSPQAKVIPGTLLVRLTGYSKQPVFDRLVDATRQMANSKSDRDYILSKLPVYPDVIAQNRSNIFAPIIYNPQFLQRAPTSTSMLTWAYDSAIAAGLAACNATTKDDNTLQGMDHFQAVTRTKFQGATGNVSFDPTTGTRQNSRYRIINIQLDHNRSNDTHVAFQDVTTSIIVDNEFIDLERPIFGDGTSNIPLDLPPVSIEHNYLSVGLQAVGWTMSAIVVVLAVSASGWVLIHGKERVILAAQPIFLHVVFSGVAILGLSIVPLSIDEGTARTIEGCNGACQSFPWFLSVGFSLIFSALSAKTHRVNRIMQNAGFRRVIVSSWDVAKPMFVVLAANVLVLSLWTALSPLQCETEVLAMDPFGRPIETTGFCTSDDSLAYWITLGVINLGPLVFSCYEAYQARDISTEYSETDYIFKALIVMCLVGSIGIPILIIAHDNPSAYFFVLSSITFVVCMSLLILILGPKVVAFYDLQMCSGGKTLPLRFSRSRRGSCAFGSSSAAKQSSVQSFSDGSAANVSGMLILKHPKTAESLAHKNMLLRVQNEELKKELKKSSAETPELLEESEEPLEVNQEVPLPEGAPVVEEDGLLEAYKRLQEANKGLQKENRGLQEENKGLLEENEELKKFIPTHHTEDDDTASA
ncbi:acid type B receptor subunit 2 [Seminavis robusta]|uniref:Acid type B receptor subunit 2 n=1 Tax=Seminavis robusta TaxID=568900 RepID=A0A9N8EU50_9STRA|nr:acid type B receptor subunit 2 [Seminavis robusta]|eukprot:Sro1579_g283740.1 acid type B receptor subunit 2 (988) ;mRNA; f:14990-18055